MLKKLLKLELTYRGRTILISYAMLLISTLIGLVGNIYYNSFRIENPQSAESISSVTNCVFMMGFFTSIFIILSNTLQNFDDKYFKNPAYLTHTLPIKAGKLLSARLMFDTVLAFVTCVLAKVCWNIVLNYDYDGMGILRSLFDTDFDFHVTGWAEAFKTGRAIIYLLTFVLIILFVVWQIYTAGAIGYAFDSGKRAGTILTHIVIMVISLVVLFAYIYAYNEIDTSMFLGGKELSPIEHMILYEGLYFVKDLILLILLLSGIATMKGTISYTFRKKLNLN